MTPDAAERSFEANCGAAWSQDHLHLILMPTEKCNFRCVYCYEDFSIGRMERPVIEGVKALIWRRAPSLSSMEINWFGGEPTVAADIVLDIMAAAQDAARAHGVKLRGGMTTNGFLLTGQRYAELHSHGVRDYQITLDGPKDFHDHTRLQANGKGSFDTIWANLLAIKNISADGEILLRVHLTARNADVIPDFVQEIEKTFAGDPRFQFHLQRIEALGGPNDISDLVMPSEGPQWGHRAGAPSEQSASLERGHEPDYVCYAAKPNSFVIRADGRVGKCTVALKSDNNCIGSIRSDGTMEIDARKLAPWLSGWKTQEQASLACPAVSVFV